MGQGFFRFFCILGQNCGRDKHGMGWDKHHGAIHSHMGGYIRYPPHPPYSVYICAPIWPKNGHFGGIRGVRLEPPVRPPNDPEYTPTDVCPRGPPEGVPRGGPPGPPRARGGAPGGAPRGGPPGPPRDPPKTRFFGFPCPPSGNAMGVLFSTFRNLLRSTEQGGPSPPCNPPMGNRSVACRSLTRSMRVLTIEHAKRTRNVAGCCDLGATSEEVIATSSRAHGVEPCDAAR